MGTTQGTNAATGQTDATEKVAAGKLVENLKNAIATADQVVGAAELALAELQTAIDSAKQGQVWLHVTNDEGKAYKSLGAFLADVLGKSGVKHHTATRRVLVAAMHAEGISLNAMKTALNVGRSTVQDDVALLKGDGKGGSTRKPRNQGGTGGKGSTDGQTDSDEVKAAKTATQVVNVLARLNDQSGFMTPETRQTVEWHLRDSLRKLHGLMDLNSERPLTVAPGTESETEGETEGNAEGNAETEHAAA